MQLKMDRDDLTGFMSDHFPQVAGDYSIEKVTKDVLSVRLHISDRNLRPGGTVSGPSMFSLADVAIYLSVQSRIGPVALAVTTNCSIDFLSRPRADRDLIGEARLLKLGRSLAVGDVLVFSEGDGAPVARATLTYSIPPGTRRDPPAPVGQISL